MPSSVRRALIAAVCAAAAAIAVPRAQSQTELDQRFLEAWKQQPRVTLAVPPGGAKVVIVKFNDWMCPGCKYWYEQLKPVLAKFQATPGAVRYVEKDWPWNSECNPNVSRTIPGHEAACVAAAAARMATDRGQREPMTAWLYANQPTTDALRQTMVARVKAKAGELLGVKDFPSAYQARLPEIRGDITEGMAASVRSTPTYFINGIRAAGPDGSMIPLHYVELAIQYELEKK